MLTTNRMGALALGVSGLLFLGAAQSPNVCRLSKREAPKGTTIIARAAFDPSQPNKSLIYWAAALGNAGLAAMLWGKKEQRQSDLRAAPALEPTSAPIPALAASESNAANPLILAQKKETEGTMPAKLKNLENFGIIGYIAAINRKTRRNFLQSAVSRTGKSTTLRAYAFAMAQLFPGLQLGLIDPKGEENGWCGLEKEQGFIFYCIADPVKPTIEILEKYHALMIYRLENRIYDQESLMIVDEYWSILDSAKDISRKLRQRIEFLTNDIARRGLVVGCRLALVSQSHNTDPIGMNAQLRSGFDIAVQVKASVNYEMLWSALNDSWLIGDNESRARLKKQAEATLEQAAELDRPVVLTSIGNWQIAELPDLRWIEQVSLVGKVQPLPFLGTKRNSLEALQDDLYSDLDSEVTVTDEDTQNSTETTFTPTPELAVTVTRLLELGMSQSQIIKDVWGYKGRNYQQGKQKFDALMAKYGNNTKPNDADDSYFVSPIPM